jgi:hypothetical protein
VFSKQYLLKVVIQVFMKCCVSQLRDPSFIYKHRLAPRRLLNSSGGFLSRFCGYSGLSRRDEVATCMRHAQRKLRLSGYHHPSSALACPRQKAPEFISSHGQLKNESPPD